MGTINFNTCNFITFILVKSTIISFTIFKVLESFGTPKVVLKTLKRYTHFIPLEGTNFFENVQMTSKKCIFVNVCRKRIEQIFYLK